MMTPIKTIVLMSALRLWGLQQASAQVTGVNIGTGLPPATLGGYTMNPFDPGAIAGAFQANLVDGSDDLGGGLYTSEPNWATWGQDYTGNVYGTYSGFRNSIQLNLSGHVEAVDFYEEPDIFNTFSVTATDSSGASVTTLINGFFGSAGIGFYEDVAGGPYLTKIVVTCDAAAYGEAIGEFGINGGTLSGVLLPDGGWTLALMALGLAGLGVYARRSVTA